MNRKGSFFGLLGKTLMRGIAVLLVIGNIVFWILLFVLSALLETLMRIFEVLQLVEYVDMKQGEPVPEPQGSRIVINGQPKASVVALRSKYVNFSMEIKMPYKRQKEQQNESRPE